MLISKDREAYLYSLRFGAPIHASGVGVGLAECAKKPARLSSALPSLAGNSSLDSGEIMIF